MTVCKCGCGMPTKNKVLGRWPEYVDGHRPIVPGKKCECGCGQQAPIAKVNDRSKGWVKGKPLKFVSGHQARLSRLRSKRKKPLYKEKDCGHTTPCWLWLRSCKSGGYGQIVRPDSSGKMKHFQAHRYFYEQHVGKIPLGMDLDHLCRKRRCVNPSHLQPVPGRVNYQRAGWRATGQVCPHCQRPF